MNNNNNNDNNNDQPIKRQSISDNNSDEDSPSHKRQRLTTTTTTSIPTTQAATTTTTTTSQPISHNVTTTTTTASTNQTAGVTEEEEEEEEAPLCGVCFCDVMYSCTTSCNHTFCYLCIKSAILSNSTCPMCRRSVTLQDIEKSSTSLKLTDFLQQLDTQKDQFLWQYSGRNNGWWFFQQEHNDIIENAYQLYLLSKQRYDEEIEAAKNAPPPAAPQTLPIAPLQTSSSAPGLPSVQSTTTNTVVNSDDSDVDDDDEYNSDYGSDDDDDDEDAHIDVNSPLYRAKQAFLKATTCKIQLGACDYIINFQTMKQSGKGLRNIRRIAKSELNSEVLSQTKGTSGVSFSRR